MTIEKVDEWLKEQYGITFTELMSFFFGSYRQNRTKAKKIKHLEEQLDQALKELDICQGTK